MLHTITLWLHTCKTILTMFMFMKFTFTDSPRIRFLISKRFAMRWPQNEMLEPVTIKIDIFLIRAEGDLKIMMFIT